MGLYFFISLSSSLTLSASPSASAIALSFLARIKARPGSTDCCGDLGVGIPGAADFVDVVRSCPFFSPATTLIYSVAAATVK